MKPADYGRLVLLAALWGASFIFVRVAAPAFGVAWTAEGRLLLGGVVLAIWFRLAGFDPQWRKHRKAYAAIGLVNLALPSLLYAFALRHMPASLGAVLNATSPIFGALCAAWFLGERLTARMILGCIAGFAGVPLVARPDAVSQTPMFVAAVLACLAACACYGYNGVIMRRHARAHRHLPDAVLRPAVGHAVSRRVPARQRAGGRPVDPLGDGAGHPGLESSPFRRRSA